MAGGGGRDGWKAHRLYSVLRKEIELIDSNVFVFYRASPQLCLIE